MHRLFVVILFISGSLFLTAQNIYEADIDDIIDDVYSYLSETEDTDYEDLQNTLLEFASQPLDINSVSADDLHQLRFLTDNQIDAILLYVYKHPMEDVAELRLIPELKDYDIRNLLPFVHVKHHEPETEIYWREFWAKARHELTARTDARYIEDPERNKQKDPFYSQFRYKINCHNQVQAGFTLRRPTGTLANGLQYGAYLQMKNTGCLKSLVAGDYEAYFGQGLVTAYSFRQGKTNCVMNAATHAEGLKKYSTPDRKGLHGTGVTLQFNGFNISTWYSLTKENDSLKRHIAGANLTYSGRGWKIGATAMEKIYSDSVRYYFKNAKYNQNYFRGNRQFVGGLNFRYRYRFLDVFGEAAAAQNLHSWGYAAIAGTRIFPLPDLGFMLLYRYYSPHYDNTVGYAYSETSRINDENGLYAGLEVKTLRHWKFSVSGDLFRFSGVKYGIKYYPSTGYDATAEVAYLPSEQWQTSLRLRAREKAKKRTFSTRYRLQFKSGGWQTKTQADATLVADSLQTMSYGVSLFQDVSYQFQAVPLVLQMRLQGFYVPKWDNRVYSHENDILYAYSNTAVYGEGGKAYLNVRYKIIKQLSLYLKVSETVYTRHWMEERNLSSRHRTDIHLLLKASL